MQLIKSTRHLKWADPEQARFGTAFDGHDHLRSPIRRSELQHCCLHSGSLKFVDSVFLYLAVFAKHIPFYYIQLLSICSALFQSFTLCTYLDSVCRLIPFIAHHTQAMMRPRVYALVTIIIVKMYSKPIHSSTLSRVGHNGGKLSEEIDTHYIVSA